MTSKDISRNKQVKSCETHKTVIPHLYFYVVWLTIDRTSLGGSE